MHPYYIARAVGGFLFLAGAAIGCWNVWMTIRCAAKAQLPEWQSESAVAAAPALQPAE
jgi:cytochrome c oxidase cbb3-type subunit 1